LNRRIISEQKKLTDAMRERQRLPQPVTTAAVTQESQPEEESRNGRDGSKEGSPLRAEEAEPGSEEESDENLM
jgi:hypothetical protein